MPNFSVAKVIVQALYSLNNLIMNPAPQVTRLQTADGRYFIFLSLDRKLTDAECNEQWPRYAKEHHDLTPPGEALCVNLCPAFRVPLSEVSPKIFRAPLDYIPPTT